MSPQSSGWVHDDLMEVYDTLHALIRQYPPHHEGHQVLTKLRDAVEHADLELADIVKEQSA